VRRSVAADPRPGNWKLEVGISELLTYARKRLHMLNERSEVRHNLCNILPALPGVLRSGGPCVEARR
jgi:hypothetical protein